MQPVLTPDEMRAADAATIAAGTPGSELMARAGFAVAHRVLQLLGGAYGRRITVICGPGNNGGDGRVAAAVLAARGVRCDVLDCESVTEADVERALGRAELVVDAMYGTGLRGPLTGPAAMVVASLGRHALPVVAVDIPSGINGATGASEGPHVVATETVTFQARKVGLGYGAGRAAAGRVTVADIGIDLAAASVGAALVEAADVRAWLPDRPLESHKWMAAVYVVGGSAGMTGAPRFVSHAAMRAGAGMVWCGVPGDAARSVDAGEVIVRSLPSTPDGTAIDAAAADVVLASVKRFTAMVVGPGLGSDARTAAAVAQLVAEAPIPMVLDADGLNAIAGDLSPLRVRAEQLGVPTVLTPHDAEFARLTGHAPHADRSASARALAAESRSIVLLKGSTTTIAAPDGTTWISMAGGPELATAGTGDALSGVIAAFLARGVPALHAAAAGAYVHGTAGSRIGPGLVASDLLGAIPPTLERIHETGV